MNQTPEQIPAEVRSIADQMHQMMRKHPDCGAEYVSAITRIGYYVDSMYVSDAEFRTEARNVVAALALVQREVAERQARLIAEVRAERAAATPPRIDSEEAARAAFALGHLEDDDNEWGGA